MGKKTKLALAIAAASAAAWASSKAVAKPQKREAKSIFDTDYPFILANFGGAHLAPAHTFEAFKKSAEIGVDGFTVSVRLTKDEEIVLAQDEKIDKVSSGVGYIKDYTLEELKAFNFGANFTSIDGERLPADEHFSIYTLNELLEQFKEHIIVINIEDSPETYEGSLMPSKLWRVIEEHQAQDRVIITSDYIEQTDRFNLYAQNSVALCGNEAQTKKVVAAFTSQFGHLYSPKVDAYLVPVKSSIFTFESAKFNQFLANLNVHLLFKDINDLASMNRLIRFGAKGIITDRPDLAKILIEKRK